MATTIRLWLREDLDREGKRQPSKALARDAETKPGPGRVVDVEARSVAEARRVLALAGAPAPDRKVEPKAWAERLNALEAVRDVELPLVAAPAKRKRMVLVDADEYAALKAARRPS